MDCHDESSIVAAHCQLLAGSKIPGYDDEYGYMPGWGKDGHNHLT